MRGNIYHFFDRQNTLNSNTLKKKTMIIAMGVLAVAIQLILACIYGVLGVFPLVLCTVVGAAGAGLACVLANRGSYNIAGLLLTGGVILVTVADDYFAGAHNNSILYLFTVLVITQLIPYKRGIAVTLSGLLPIFMTALYIFGNWHTPVYNVGDVMYTFAVINILVTSSGVILLIGLSRLVGSYADDYHRQRIDELETQTYRDALTQLYNRRFADMHLKKLAEDEPGRSVCIAMADLDDFKRVNDTYGHDAGDTALREVARLFRENLRKTDMVIRWGGEEIVVILHDAPINLAFVVLDKLRGIIQEHTISHDEHRFGLTVTMGITELDCQNPHASIKSCDDKLYAGKRGGKNRVVV